MYDCVAQSFPERKFDIVFLAGDAVRSLDKPHQAVDQGGDGRNFTRNPSVDFQQAFSGARPSQVRSQIRVSV
jgi:hypothetical protein